MEDALAHLLVRPMLQWLETLHREGTAVNPDWVARRVVEELSAHVADAEACEVALMAGALRFLHEQLDKEEQMGTVGEIIAKNHSGILHLWTQTTGHAASARGLSPQELASMIPAYLSLLGRGIHDGTAHLSDEQKQLIEHHLSNRLRQGFDLSEILGEFSVLGRCVFQFVDAAVPPERPTTRDLRNLSAQLQLTSVDATRIFNEHLLEDEQTEKRYTRLLQNLAREACGVPVKARLQEILSLIMDAMGAQTSALLLYDAKSHQLVMSASAGDADEHLAVYASSLDPSSFAGKIASREGETTSVSDAATTELEVTETLRHSGIHSLIGVRLSAGHALRGVLYVGIRDRRAFTASEIRRIEGLSERLTVHLDNAQLNATLRKKVNELRGESELRERFVAMLLHDLSAPLRTARQSAAVLSQVQTPQNAQTLAGRIVRSLDQVERMVGDLVDAHRIRAGERLPLTITDCDLSVLAQKTVEELRTLHGDRFVLHADKSVRGMWSSDQLRRALWNLCTNAVEYGDEGASVEISVNNGAEGAQVAVHNRGPALSTSEQEKLFTPFSQRRAAIDGHPHGWGLGLTLIWGCAEAHGGRVSVESLPERGTTFTMVLPFDARPYSD